MTTRRVLLTLAAVAVVTCATARAQQQSQLEARLDSAVVAVDAADIEHAVTLLRSLTDQFTATTDVELRFTAFLLLGEVYWALGFADSAVTQFQAAVRSDPFRQLHDDFFNPELMGALRAARRETSVLGMRARPDTVLDPVTGVWPVSLALGRPGQVELRLTGPGFGGRDSLVATVQVDSALRPGISLLVSDSVAIEPGTYTLLASLVTVSGRETARLEFSVERQPADTNRHESPLDRSVLFPETRRGSVSIWGIARGLVFGAAAATIPTVLTHADMGNETFEPRAVVLGATITLGALLGSTLGRPTETVAENVTRNREMVSAWEQRNRAIARQNAARIRLAPLRIRLQRTP